MSSHFWDSEGIVLSKDILNIILLVHVEQPRGYTNPSQLQCSKTERFSIEEFNEIYQGIVDAGYYIQAVYYNELDFISEYVEHPGRFQNCLVYNLARNGIGANKKTIIPSFCELVGIKYSSSPSLSCALCRNKYYFTSLFRAHNIPVPKSWLLSETGDWVNGAPPNGTQVICKPCAESASQGVNEHGIFVASSSIFNRFVGCQYIVQEYIEGEECEVPVFKVGNVVKVLEPVGIDLLGKCILDEQASADNCYNFYRFRTSSLHTMQLIKEYTARAFNLMQMEVYGRIDFRVAADGIPYIFDISTTPYTTKHSSVAFAFQQIGLKYCDIYEAIIFSALQRSNSVLK